MSKNISEKKKKRISLGFVEFRLEASRKWHRRSARSELNLLEKCNKINKNTENRAEKDQPKWTRIYIWERALLPASFRRTARPRPRTRVRPASERRRVEKTNSIRARPSMCAPEDPICRKTIPRAPGASINRPTWTALVKYETVRHSKPSSPLPKDSQFRRKKTMNKPSPGRVWEEGEGGGYQLHIKHWGYTHSVSFVTF